MMSLEGLFPIDKWDLKSGSILHQLPEADEERLRLHMSEQRYAKGDLLFREGGLPLGIFFIREGRVKRFTADRDQKEHILYVANKGELLGYHAVLAEERFPDSAAALEDTQVAFIPREDFLATLDTSTVLSRRLLRAFSHEYTVLTNSISVFAQRSVRERLAITLIVLREKYRENGHRGPVSINISREDLANMVGTAKENVVRLLREFKTAHIVETRGRTIFITNLKKLIGISTFGPEGI